MERGAWNMEALCIRHTRRSFKRGDVHVQFDLFALSHNTPDRRVQRGMIRTRSCFPQTIELATLTIPHEDGRRQQLAQNLVQANLVSVFSTYAFSKLQPTVFRTTRIAGSAGLRRGEQNPTDAQWVANGERRLETPQRMAVLAFGLNT